ncbi:DapH/DapD/GlmU-related protein [Bizionia sediminis]|uniref:DapH/DapD/GlmU-related protein n=1 Tax=Bizionia sediminis TaxID=1737064 RepID=A0ABW5KXJ7_9FLAO
MESKAFKINKNCKIHKLAYIEEDVEIGEGTEIGPFCIVRKGAKIGSNCKFTAYCEIRENVVVGDNTSFGSRCTISANCRIGNNVVIKYGFVMTDTPDLAEHNSKVSSYIADNVLIGANVCLMPGFNIKRGAIVGACSQVRSEIGEEEIWYGSPAKFYKKKA